jgi:hypothetical protein
MKGNENHAAKGLWDKAELTVGGGAVTNWLAEDNHIVFEYQEALP